jgi:hypothetical protein
MPCCYVCIAIVGVLLLWMYCIKDYPVVMDVLHLWNYCCYGCTIHVRRLWMHCFRGCNVLCGCTVIMGILLLWMYWSFGVRLLQWDFYCVFSAVLDA